MLDMSASEIARSHSGLSRAEQLSGVIDVSVPRPSRGPLVEVLGAVAGAVGVVLLVPWIMLLITLPIALAVRGVAEVIGWLVAGSGG